MISGPTPVRSTLAHPSHSLPCQFPLIARIVDQLNTAPENDQKVDKVGALNLAKSLNAMIRNYAKIVSLQCQGK